MQKAFTTFIQQIDLLQQEKKIIIADTAYAEDIIKRTGYFPLMGGYKQMIRMKFLLNLRVNCFVFRGDIINTL